MTLFDPPAARPPRPRLIVALACAATALLAGCEKQEAITLYETPRVEPRTEAIDVAEVRKLLDHMFAAVVPAGEKAWFFKLVVPASAADAVRKPFDEFVATVDAQPQAELPEWKLPEGWTAAKGGNELGAATITIPHGAESFEITVSALPWTGDWTALLEENVSRWMGQLGQLNLDRATIAKMTELARELPTKGKPAAAFEFVGTMQRNPMGMAAGLPAGHPPVSDAPAAGEAAPPAATRAAAPAAAAPSSAELTYDAPAGWQPGPANPMRKASFVIAGDGGEAVVTVTRFPPVGQMADPTANAQRWAGDVQLRLSAADAAKVPTAIEIAGAPGHRFEMYSPDDAPRALGLLAAMTVRGEQVWFIKFLGDRALVESQREAFDQFLASLRFAASE